ncbi:hypothetical protein [Maioricimonas sp. JC845]|uniref:hypothetical protein n=1 Tax=Maioricimonas sp. JC845 TaxID=3232138 RepID=UPI00345A7372
MEELLEAHAELEQASRNVTGTIKVYRAEAWLPEGDRDRRTEDRLRLVLSGSIWRMGDTVRVDYVTWPHIDPSGNSRPKVRRSLAVNGDDVYIFEVGASREMGTLTVYQRESGNSELRLGYLDRQFLQPLDALWRQDATRLTDALQRPGTTLRLAGLDQERDVVEMRVVDEQSNSVSDALLDARRSFLLRRIRASSNAGALTARVELDVTAESHSGRYLPRRIVEAANINGDGYTQVIELQLAPLDSDSPEALDLSRLSPESFVNVGVGYQVIYGDEQGRGRLGKRFRTPASLPRPDAGWLSRSAVLTVLLFNAVLLVSVALWGRYKRKHAGKGQHGE